MNTSPSLPLRSNRTSTTGSGGLGYHPDLPDLRDFVLNPSDPGQSNSELKRAITALRKSIKISRPKLHAVAGSALLGDPAALPKQIDLCTSGFFSPVEDQGELGSCTAQAVIGLVEYLVRAGGGDPLDLSRLFLYKTTRRLLGWSGDTGAHIRTTIKAMVLFGVPPESVWPYDPAQLDGEPDAFHYAFARNFRATVYARLDGYGSDGEKTRKTVCKALVDGFPIAFGFPVYNSISEVTPKTPVIPAPTGAREEKLLGGHAVLAVGFDDTMDCGKSGVGALKIRNSWGAGWGESGYAYLPYSYIDSGLAVDFWTIFNADWARLSDGV